MELQKGKFYRFTKTTLVESSINKYLEKGRIIFITNIREGGVVVRTEDGKEKVLQANLLSIEPY